MRHIIDLNGKWRFVLDPKNIGEIDNWYITGLTKAMDVQVPHIWQREGEDYVSYNGAAWYEKDVCLSAIDNSQTYHLCFGAVDYACSVWWNGHYIGEHEGGFTPFDFEIQNEFIKSSNRITIRVYDYEANAEIPIGKQGSWYTRVSGIWQAVKLEARSRQYIHNTFVTPYVDEEKLDLCVAVKGDVSGDTIIHYRVQGHSFLHSSWESEDSYTGFINPMQQADFTLLQDDTLSTYKTVLSVPEMKKWSPNEPYLYELEVVLEKGGIIVDQFVSTFGYRKVEQKDGRIYVNDQPVYIRGALDQAFYPDTIYTAPSTEFIQKEIQLAKEMGFNLLRKHIKAELPEYLYWADRLGMLIWAEPPNYVKWTNSARIRFVALLREMMIRDYNHPSIIIWSIYNEEWGLEWDLAFDKKKQAHVLELFEEVKKWDGSRIFCDNSGWTHIKTDINDHHRYFSLPEQLDEWEKDLDDFVIGQRDRNFVEGFKSEGEPLIVSEFGMWGLPSIPKLREYYKGKEPWWFINQGDGTHQDDYKKPTTALENHSKFGIEEALGDLDNLAVLSQKRMFRGVKSLIEEMRKRPQLAGYVITELTDIEWETNGWLDFMREPKEGFERLIDFNGPTCLFADVTNHNIWSGEEVAWDVVVVDDEGLVDEALVRWEFVLDGDSVPLLAGEQTISLNKEHYTNVPNAIRFNVPIINSSGFAYLELKLVVKGEVVASNKEELTVSNKQSISFRNTSVFLYNVKEALKKEVEASGLIIEEELNDNSIVITDKLDRKIYRHLQNGGHAIFLAENANQIEESGPYTFRELALGESWPRASSMNYINTSWFDSVPLHPEVGWEARSLCPDYVIPFADYKKEGTKRTINMFGNPRLAEEAEVISGYFQGWLGQNGGSIVHHRVGKGSVLIVTWKLKDNYGKHPIATQLLNKMIEKVKERMHCENPIT